MTTRIGINGFGRIGRNVFRASLGDPSWNLLRSTTSPMPKRSLICLSTTPSTGPSRPLLRRKDDQLLIDGRAIKVFAKRDPKELPWKGSEWISSSNPPATLPTEREQASTFQPEPKRHHLCPAKDPDATVVLGVNETNLRR